MICSSFPGRVAACGHRAFSLTRHAAQALSTHLPEEGDIRLAQERPWGGAARFVEEEDSAPGS